MDVRTTDPKHWKYVSEGGATIVFSYQGPEDAHFSGTVLRLRKAIVPRVKSGKHANSDEEEPDDPTIQYQKLCMERLIPPAHLPRLETVGLDRAWLEKLIALTDSLRPFGRRSKDQIDLDRTKGVLATDLVGGDWIAVEIKVTYLSVKLFIRVCSSLAAEMGIHAFDRASIQGDCCYKVADV